MTQKIKRINLALQGGGAHGAFTWGVLDRLLEVPLLDIAAISGTSAGAMNGAALKAGWVSGEAAGAKENLDWLWERLGAISDLRMTSWLTGFLPDAPMMHQWMEMTVPLGWLETASAMTTPYAFGPFYMNPLRPIAEAFDYDRVCQDCGPQLHIGATNVRTGKIRVFTGAEVSSDAILASACLPTLFQAVEIDDPDTGRTEAFWDGGYAGNPALFPLQAPDLPRDIVIVNINPIERDEVPKTPQEISNRLSEISFNASLLGELQTIKAARNSQSPRGQSHIHMIADDALMNELSGLTRLVPNPVVLSRLKEAGRAAADQFLKDHFDAIGERDSVDLDAMFG